METTRQSKISRLIQKELGTIFQQESRNLFANAMISVTNVSVSKDMSIAKVYLSMFATQDKEALLTVVKEHTKIIRHTMAGKVRHQLRVIPQLDFFIDDSIDYFENIDKLLKK